MTAKSFLNIKGFILAILLIVGCENNPSSNNNKKVLELSNTQGGGGTGTRQLDGKDVVSDIFIVGAGNRVQLSEETKSYLLEIEKLLSLYGITKRGFWTQNILSHLAEYRFVQNEDELPCDERAFLYAPIGESFKFGCTDGNMTFLIESAFERFETFQMKSLAILHERLHTICPKCASGPQKIYITEFVKGVHELIVLRDQQRDGLRELLTQTQLDNIYNLFYRALDLNFSLDQDFLGDKKGFNFIIWPFGGGMILANTLLEISPDLSSPPKWKEAAGLYKYASIKDDTETVKQALESMKKNVFIGIGSIVKNKSNGPKVREEKEIFFGHFGAINPFFKTDVVNSRLEDVFLAGGNYNNIEAKCASLVRTEIRSSQENEDALVIKYAHMQDSTFIDSLLLYSRPSSTEDNVKEYEVEEESSCVPLAKPNIHLERYSYFKQKVDYRVNNSSIRDTSLYLSSVENSSLLHANIIGADIYDSQVEYSVNIDVPHRSITQSLLHRVNLKDSPIRKSYIGISPEGPWFENFIKEKTGIQAKLNTTNTYFWEERINRVFDATDTSDKQSTLQECSLDRFVSYGAINCFNSKLSSAANYLNRIWGDSSQYYVVSEGLLDIRNSILDYSTLFHELNGSDDYFDDLKTVSDVRDYLYRFTTLHINSGVSVNSVDLAFINSHVPELVPGFTLPGPNPYLENFKIKFSSTDYTREESASGPQDLYKMKVPKICSLQVASYPDDFSHQTRDTLFMREKTSCVRGL